MVQVPEFAVKKYKSHLRIPDGVDLAVLIKHKIFFGWSKDLYPLSKMAIIFYMCLKTSPNFFFG